MARRHAWVSGSGRTGGLARREAFVLLAVAAWSGTTACQGADPAGAAPGDVPTIAAHLDLRIDGYEADLVPITWMGVGPDGTMALIQWQDRNVRFFGPDGTPLGTVGGPGAGPGEFERPVRGGWVGDTLWISDTQLGRVTFISPELEAVRILTMPTELRAAPDAEERYPVFTSAVPYAVYRDGTLLIGAIPASGDPLAERFTGPPLLRTSTEGRIEHTVMERPDLEGTGITVSLEGGGAAASMIPFMHQPIWANSPSGDRLAVLTTAVSGPDAGTFRVTHVDAGGEVLFDRTYAFEGVPIPARVADSAVAAAAERANFPELRRVIQSDMRGLVPLVYSPVRTGALVLGTDGRIWVGLRPTAEGGPWLALASDGTPDSQVLLPGNVTVRAADRQHLWAIERDEMGIESVVRYRIDPPTPDTGRDS